MSQIIKIEGTEVYIGTDEQGVLKTPIATINYANPQVGDEVNVFKDGENTIVTRKNNGAVEVTNTQQQAPQGTPYFVNEKRMNKHIFVWIGTFFVGGLGVDRFMRGQIGLGILKLITLGGCGVWSLIDFIIGLSKVYGSSFGQTDEVTFINGKYAK